MCKIARFERVGVGRSSVCSTQYILLAAPQGDESLVDNIYGNFHFKKEAKMTHLLIARLIFRFVSSTRPAYTGPNKILQPIFNSCYSVWKHIFDFIHRICYFCSTSLYFKICYFTSIITHLL